VTVVVEDEVSVVVDVLVDDVVVVVVEVSVDVEVLVVVVDVVVDVTVVLVDVCVLVDVELVYRTDFVSEIVDWVVDHALSVDVVATVDIDTVMEAMVVVAHTVPAADVIVDAWLIQFTVVVFVSPPPTFAG